METIPPKNSYMSSEAPLGSVIKEQPKVVLQQILSRVDVDSYVVQLDPQELFFLIREIGLIDSIELLRYCSVDQIQYFLDLDCWIKDQFIHPKIFSWFRALLELGFEPFGELFEQLDNTLLTTFFIQYIRVYDLSLEEVPEEPVGHFYVTPDRFYVVDILPSEHSDLIERILENLYKKSLQLGYKTLMSIKWDSGVETEEQAYQFHTARMADLGYFSPEEAIKIYGFLDLASVNIGEGTGPEFSIFYNSLSNQVFIPKEWEQEFQTDLLINQIFGSLPTPTRNIIFHHLLFLINRALSTEYIAIGEVELAQPIVRSTLSYLSLGLEYLCYASLQQNYHKTDSLFQESKLETNRLILQNKGTEALQTISLQRIFQVGYNLVTRLSKLSQILASKGFITLQPEYDSASLLEPPDSEVIRLLGNGRNKKDLLYYCGLDEKLQNNNRPFKTLQDVNRTAAVLEKLGVISQFFIIGLGVQKDFVRKNVTNLYQNIADIRLVHLLGTLVSNLVLGRPLAFVPLIKEDIPLLEKSWFARTLLIGKRENFYDEVKKAILDRIKERSLNQQEEELLCSKIIQDFIYQTLSEIDESLGNLSKKLDERNILMSVSGFLIRKNQ